MDPAYSFTVTLSDDMRDSCITRRFTTIPLFTFMPPFPIGTFVGVGVSVAMFLFLVLLTLVVVIILVVVVVERRKGANKQKRSTPLTDNLRCNNSVVVTQEMEMIKEGMTSDNGDGYEDVDYDLGEDDDPVEDSIKQYEFDDRKEHIKNTNTPAPKELCTSVSASSVPAVYTVVDKSKKKGPKAMVEKGSFPTNNDLYAMPMKMCGKMTDTGKGISVFIAVEEGQYDDTVGYKPKADSKL